MAKDKFDKRYAEWWNHISRLTRSVCPTCCWCLNAPATEVHHVYYRDEHGSIAGRETPGIEIFPVCEKCHKTALHTKRYWVYEPVNPALNNHNTPEAIRQLRFGFDQLQRSKGAA